MVHERVTLVEVMVVVRRFLTGPGGAVLTASDNIMVVVFLVSTYINNQLPGHSLVCSSPYNLQHSPHLLLCSLANWAIEKVPWQSVRERYRFQHAGKLRKVRGSISYDCYLFEFHAVPFSRTQHHTHTLLRCVHMFHHWHCEL